MLSRMVGHITYLSDDAMGTKFGRGLKSEKLNYDFNSVEFQVESYLRYQGEEFSSRRSEEHTYDLQSLMRTSYDVFCLKKKYYTARLIVLFQEYKRQMPNRHRH